MYPIDNIKINFSTDNLLVLNIILAFIMFAIALDIQKADFEHLLKDPKPALVGMTAQLVVLPLVTILLVFAFNPPPSVGLGMVAISACPGGNNSNYSTHLAKGNTALAVTTTSISVLVCIITMPLYIYLGSKIIPNMHTLQRDVQLNVWEMFKIVGLLILLPLVAGMYVSHQFPNIKAKIIKPMKVLSLIGFVSLILGALLANLNNIVENVKAVFNVVFALNLCALLFGYYFAKVMNLKEADRRAITFETGIHNVTLALIIVFNFFDGLGGMALVAAWYGIWDLLTGFGLALWWQRKGIV